MSAVDDPIPGIDPSTCSREDLCLPTKASAPPMADPKSEPTAAMTTRVAQSSLAAESNPTSAPMATMPKKMSFRICAAFLSLSVLELRHSASQLTVNSGMEAVATRSPVTPSLNAHHDRSNERKPVRGRFIDRLSVRAKRRCSGVRRLDCGASVMSRCWIAKLAGIPSSVAPNTARPPGAHFVSTRRMSSNCGREPVYPLVYPWDRWKTKRVSSLRANPLILLAEWTSEALALFQVSLRFKF